jgi:hypothetical protein
MTPWLQLLFWMMVIGLAVPVAYAIATARPGLTVAALAAFAVAAAVHRVFGR